MADARLMLAHRSDGEAVAEIYHDYVEKTCISFELEAPGGEEMARRIEEIGAVYPFILCRLEGRVVGYAYAHRFLARAAYAWDAETSVYVDGNFHGRRIGRALYDALEGLLREIGVINLYALVAMPNVKSEHLHAGNGFSEVGRLRRAGFKFGKWHDVAYYEKCIALHEVPPEPVRPIGRLDRRRVSEILERAAGIIR